MREKPRPGKAACNRAGRRRCFDDALATCAGELGSHMANDLEVSRDELQYLGYVFSEVAQRAAAIGAAVVLWMMGYDLAGQMFWQRLPPQRRSPVAGDPGLREGFLDVGATTIGSTRTSAAACAVCNSSR